MTFFSGRFKSLFNLYEEVLANFLVNAPINVSNIHRSFSCPFAYISLWNFVQKTYNKKEAKQDTKASSNPTPPWGVWVCNSWVLSTRCYHESQKTKHLDWDSGTVAAVVHVEVIRCGRVRSISFRLYIPSSIKVNMDCVFEGLSPFYLNKEKLKFK